MQKLVLYVTVPLRWGVGFVFLYFGLSKYLWSQREIAQFIDMGMPASLAPTANFIFGGLEIFVAISMFLGIFVRQAALVASTLLVLIIGGFTLKFGKLGLDTVFRDLAILGASLSLIVRHHDPWCLEKPKSQ